MKRPHAPLSAATALFMALCAAPAARAQSLIELYESARGFDATWQSAKAQYDAALFRAEQLRAGLLPQAGLALGANRTRFDNNVPDITRSYGNQSATVSAAQPLYRPVNVANFRQGQRSVEIAQGQLTVAAQDLVLRVSQAYFDVLAAQDTLAFVRAQKAATAEQLASAKRNFEVGTSTITDSREAQARFDLVTAQEIAADNDLRVKRLQLDTLTGRQNTQPQPLALPTQLPSPEPADMERWVEQSEASSPQIAQARGSVDVAQLETEKARAGHLPTVDLTASYGLSRNPNGSVNTTVGSRSTSGQIGVTLNVPLFAGFSTQNRIRETLSLEERAQADLENARRTVAQQTRTAYLGVMSGQGQVRALEAAEASSQSALDANRLGYQVGVRINIDVLNAQSQLFQTKRDLAQARYNVLLGNLRLKQANGTLRSEDLTSINALLAR